MREAEIELAPEALRELGFETVEEGATAVDVLDVTLLRCAGGESLSVTTVSEPIDELLDREDAVEWYERLDASGDSVTYLCKTGVPDLPPSATPPGTELSVQTVRPNGVGGFTLTLVGTHEAISSELGGCGDGHPPVTLERLAEYEGPTEGRDRLTPRQREVVETAHELGYYEVPREATAADVADRLDLDRSTVTEHLQRAERRLVSAALT